MRIEFCLGFLLKKDPWCWSLCAIFQSFYWILTLDTSITKTVGAGTDPDVVLKRVDCRLTILTA